MGSYGAASSPARPPGWHPVLSNSLTARRREAGRGAPYLGDVTSAHAYELSPHASPPAEAVEAAERGQVVHLTRNGESIAAIVPADVAVAGAAAVEALEDAQDIRAARVALVEPGSDVPMSQVWADYADILGPYPDAEVR